MTETAVKYEVFEVEREGDIAIVRISNPPMNVINITFGQELDRVLDDIAGDESIRAVLFTSAIEGVFIAGADLTLLGDLTPEKAEQFRQLGGVFDKLAALPQPTVAALGGTTLGGGFEFALACDFRLMAEGFGEIGLPEVRLGVLPGGGGTQRLPRLVSAGVATEMLIKGMRYNPQKALELGLVHRIFPQTDLYAEALKYTKSLAAQAPCAVQSIKRLIRAAYETPGPDGLDLERELFMKLVRTEDAQEGIKAFFEGRKPAFQGR